MKIDFLVKNDINDFLLLAREEGWICDRWEFDFLLNSFPQGCLVVREGEKPVAFVTSIKYGFSGWIGNLLVRPDLRGRGVGTTLMRNALSALRQAGAGTVWLTASTAGKGIYEKMGFAAIDDVCRRRGRGRVGKQACTPPMPSEIILAMDYAGWGDLRQELIEAVTARGKLFTGCEGYLLVQPNGNGIQLGPWSSLDPTNAETLLSVALSGKGDEVDIFLDVPAGNRTADKLLSGHGFSSEGGAVLMYWGDRPDYKAGFIYGLASMGSMG